MPFSNANAAQGMLCALLLGVSAVATLEPSSAAAAHRPRPTPTPTVSPLATDVPLATDAPLATDSPAATPADTDAPMTTTTPSDAPTETSTPEPPMVNITIHASSPKRNARKPKATPRPTSSPTSTPSPADTDTPTPTPTPSPTESPFLVETPVPTATPTPQVSLFDFTGGPWECITFGGTKFTHEFSRTDDTQTILVDTVVRVKSRTMSLRETFVHHASAERWSVSIAGGLRAEATEWTGRTWTFVGTSNESGTTKKIRMSFTMIGRDQFRRDFESYDHGTWTTYAGENCDRPL